MRKANAALQIPFGVRSVNLAHRGYGLYGPVGTGDRVRAEANAPMVHVPVGALPVSFKVAKQSRRVRVRPWRGGCTRCGLLDDVAGFVLVVDHLRVRASSLCQGSVLFAKKCFVLLDKLLGAKRAVRAACTNCFDLRRYNSLIGAGNRRVVQVLVPGVSFKL